MLHMGGILVASTVFVFLHPNYFPMWCGFVGTVGGIFHWLVIRDQKVPDACALEPHTDS